MVFAGTPRMHASTSDADEQPAAATNDWWVVSRADNKGKRPAGTGPLSSAATENSPCADGTDNRVSTSHPPAEFPKSIACSGSPPNAAILLCTHFKAAT